MRTTVAEHGTRNRYQKGCRCETCKRANADYKAGLQAANKARTQAATEAYHASGGEGGIPSLEHGKASTYLWLGCRCQQCKEAYREPNRRYKRNYRQRQQLIYLSHKMTQQERNTA
jgi:hypothetical protein